jgi:hypothetical protein
MSPLKREQRSRRSTRSTYRYNWKTRSKLGILNIVFLDVWLSPKAWYQLTQARPALRLLFQFLGAFSQGQVPTQTLIGTVWSWGFCPSSLELSRKARYQLTQARSHCWLQQYSKYLSFANKILSLEMQFY